MCLGAAVNRKLRGKALFRCGLVKRYQIEANSEYLVLFLREESVNE